MHNNEFVSLFNGTCFTMHRKMELWMQLGDSFAGRRKERRCNGSGNWAVYSKSLVARHFDDGSNLDLVWDIFTLIDVDFVLVAN